MKTLHDLVLFRLRSHCQASPHCQAPSPPCWDPHSLRPFPLTHLLQRLAPARVLRSLILRGRHCILLCSYSLPQCHVQALDKILSEQKGPLPFPAPPGMLLSLARLQSLGFSFLAQSLLCTSVSPMLVDWAQNSCPLPFPQGERATTYRRCVTLSTSLFWLEDGEASSASRGWAVEH